MPILEVNQGAGEIYHYFLLPSQTYTIGRKECQLPLPNKDPSISRHHANITVNHTEPFISILDCSKHGTLVNRELIGRGIGRFIYTDETIKFGKRVSARVLPTVLVLAESTELTEVERITFRRLAFQLGGLVVQEPVPSPESLFEMNYNCLTFLYITHDKYKITPGVLLAMAHNYHITTLEYLKTLVVELQKESKWKPQELPIPEIAEPINNNDFPTHMYIRPTNSFFDVNESLTSVPQSNKFLYQYTFILPDMEMKLKYESILNICGANVVFIALDNTTIFDTYMSEITTVVVANDKMFTTLKEILINTQETQEGLNNNNNDYCINHKEEDQKEKEIQSAFITLYKNGACIIPEQNIGRAIFTGHVLEINGTPSSEYLLQKNKIFELKTNINNIINNNNNNNNNGGECRETEPSARAPSTSSSNATVRIHLNISSEKRQNSCCSSSSLLLLSSASPCRRSPSYNSLGNIFTNREPLQEVMRNTANNNNNNNNTPVGRRSKQSLSIEGRQEIIPNYQREKEIKKYDDDNENKNPSEIYENVQPIKKTQCDRANSIQQTSNENNKVLKIENKENKAIIKKDQSITSSSRSSSNITITADGEAPVPELSTTVKIIETKQTSIPPLNITCIPLERKPIKVYAPTQVNSKGVEVTNSARQKVASNTIFVQRSNTAIHLSEIEHYNNYVFNHNHNKRLGEEQSEYVPSSSLLLLSRESIPQQKRNQNNNNNNNNKFRMLNSVYEIHSEESHKQENIKKMKKTKKPQREPYYQLWSGSRSSSTQDYAYKSQKESEGTETETDEINSEEEEEIYKSNITSQSSSRRGSITSLRYTDSFTHNNYINNNNNNILSRSASVRESLRTPRSAPMCRFASQQQHLINPQRRLIQESKSFTTKSSKLIKSSTTIINKKKCDFTNSRSVSPRDSHLTRYASTSALLTNSHNSNISSIEFAQQQDIFLCKQCETFMQEFLHNFTLEAEKSCKLVRRQTYLDVLSKKFLEDGIRRVQEFLSFIQRTEKDIPAIYSSRMTREITHTVRQTSLITLRLIKTTYAGVKAQLPTNLQKLRESVSSRPASPRKTSLHRQHSVYM